MWVGSFQEKVDIFDFNMVQVCKARGSGGMPPRKILKNRYQKTEFGDILATKAPLNVGVYSLYIIGIHPVYNYVAIY